MFDLTAQEKKVLIVLSAFALLGLAVLSYKTYFARPELKIIRSPSGLDTLTDYEKAIKKQNTVDINNAPAAQIEELPGIGPKLAKTIVDYRTEHGSFLIKEDLMKVRGIGRSKFDGIKDLILLE